MTGRFREVLAAGAVPWTEVAGDREERVRAALEAVDGVLARGWRLGEPLG